MPLKGYKPTKEHCKNISRAQRGHKLSKKSKNKISIANSLKLPEIIKRLKLKNLTLLSKFSGMNSEITLRCFCGNIFKTKAILVIYYSKKSCGCIRRGKNSYGWSGYGEISGRFFQRIKANSKYNRNLDFKITIQYIWKLFLKQHKRCALSGVPINFSKTNYALGTASLDRINSKLGYTPNNVQWVHKDLNFMKSDMDNSIFIDWCKKIAKNNN